MASRALLLALALALSLIFAAREAASYSCTDGQTCLCDCYANTDGTSNDTFNGVYANSTCQARGIPKRSNVDFCEDFENPLLNDGDTQVYQDSYVSTYGDDARWGDGWSQVYGPTAGDCLGPLPSGQGIKARGAEGLHSWSCFNVVQEGVCEITDTDCVYDGTSSLSMKQRPGSESSMGSGKTFSTPRRKTFGITMMMRWSGNYVSPHDPGTDSVAHKTDQFLTSGGSCTFGCSTTNAGASQTPFGSVFLGLAGNPEAPDGVVSIGSTEWTTPGWRYTPPLNLYTFQRSQWRCFQQKVTNIGETNARVEHWVDGVKVFDAYNLDLIYSTGQGATANNNGVNEILFDNYYNTGYDGSTLAMRGEDNIVFSNGDPVSCDEVKTGLAGPTITIQLVDPSDTTPALSTPINVSTTFSASGTTGTLYADIDCENDGGWEDGTQSGTSPITNTSVCSYGTAGTKTIGVRIRDSGSTVATSFTTVTVGSSVTISSVSLDDSTPDQSTPVDVTVAFSNVNGVANYTLAVDCENDGGYEDGSQAGASSPITVSNVCSYASSGAQTIGVRVTDSGTASDTDSTTLTVNQPSGGGGSCSTPTIDASDTGTADASATVSADLTGVDARAYLYCTFANADDGNTRADWTVTSSPSLIWTRRADAEASGSGNAEIWTSSEFAAGGSITVTGTLSSATYQSVACYAITGAEAPGSGATATETGETTPSTTITTTQDDSLIIGVVSDYDATAGGSTPTYRTPPTHTEALKHNTAGYNAWHVRAAPTTAGAYTMGLTIPTGQSSGAVYLEVRCTETAPGAPTLSNVTITPSDSTPAFGATWTAQVSFSASSTTSPYTVLLDCDSDGFDDGTGVGNSSPISITGVCPYYTAGVATVTAQVSDTGPTATATGSTTVTVDAPTLTISSVTVDPNTGTPPTNDADVTVAVGGTATGAVGLLVDCTSNGTYDGGAYCATTPCTAPDVCDFQTAGTFTVYATAIRSNVSSSATATATISSPISLGLESVTPSASGGPAPLLGIDLLFILTGSATGSVLLEADCDGGGGFEATATDTTEPFLMTDACGFQYAGIYTIPVRVTRGGLQVSGTLVIDVSDYTEPSVVFFSPNGPASSGWVPTAF